MPRTEGNQFEVERLRTAVPFRPFILLLESGQQVHVEHPENIAFDPTLPPGSRGAGSFHVISRGIWMAGTFDAVTAVFLDEHNGQTS